MVISNFLFTYYLIYSFLFSLFCSFYEILYHYPFIFMVFFFFYFISLYIHFVFVVFFLFFLYFILL
jgi:hypothetical protein